MSFFTQMLSMVWFRGTAYLLFDGYRASTINWQTFSQVTPGLRES